MPTIYVYAGPGVDDHALAHSKRTLETFLDSTYRIAEIQPDDVKTKNWQHNAACFVMPGGADCPYQKHLHPDGNDAIKAYVHQGGSYLGICAGAYYGSKTVAFDLGGPCEVHQDRDLQFFKGSANGPVLAPYVYGSRKGARAAEIQWGEQIIRLYVNGGGYFVNAQNMPDVNVLARYVIEGTQKPAVIETKPGKGTAILSGAHFEYDPTYVGQEALADPYLANILPLLKAQNNERIAFLLDIFNRLGL